ncbi:MAG: potassium channel family protein [Chroococcales cyanobacterium]
MNIIIIGASPTGASLIELALESGHKVTLIEENEERARQILEQHNITVLNADIAKGGILDEAKADQADALVATTNDDSANLMAIFLGKKHGIKKLAVMLNNRQHKEMFEKLGVNVLVDPATIIAQRLYSFIESESK